ncbi:MAG: tRNA 4-thiouridine(8) synthase ThiI, partial [Treponema sp.]|nr:tRNA 4-thiouridine(8) synthase ThiI [Treponema sp.]
AAQNGAKSFKCDARRADKTFPFDSYQINKEAAAKVFDQKILKVDVHNPDVKVFIEVREQVFIYANDKKAVRGLPVGVSGNGLLLLSGGIDSPVAGWRMMRRGMKVDAVYFHSYPYTSDEAQKKVEDLAAQISKYGISLHLHIVSFTEAQMQIKKSSPENYSTLLLRMCMMSVANKIAERIGAQCIVTGESLGQVASQTIENMAVTEMMAAYPLIRPLAGMDKEEIISDAVRIGTYDTSILPYEDCCVLFSPKHPILKANKEEAKKIYDGMQIEGLLEEAYNTRTIKNFFAGKEISVQK